jgi:RNA polymerase sigma factor (sigma-70 family)
MKNYYEEHQLVSLLKANDKEAFEYLYDNYSGALYNVISRIVKDDDDASDVMQDVFLKIWKSIHCYTSERGSLFTWMLNIARNRAIDLYRIKAKHPSKVEMSDLNEETGLYSYAVLPLFELDDVAQLLKVLHPNKRCLIDLVYLQGFTHEEVSKILLIPLGTVKSRIRTALCQLRQLLDAPNLSYS